MPPKENSAAERVRDNQAGRFVLRAPRRRNIQRSFNASWPATATCLLRASLTTSRSNVRELETLVSARLRRLRGTAASHSPSCAGGHP